MTLGFGPFLPALVFDLSAAGDGPEARRTSDAV